MQVGRPAAAALFLLASGACSGAPKAGAPAPVAAAISYSPIINPFPVIDSAGRVLDLAFLGGFNQPRPQLLDVNGDGKLDLMLQEYTNRLVYLERDGTATDSLPQFQVRSQHFADLNVGEWSRFADMDGDGKVDVLAEWPSSYIRYFRNVGTPSSPRYEAAPDTVRDATGKALFADRQNIPQVGDIDCDGIPDLLVGRITGIILEYISQKPAIPAPTFKLITDRFQDLEIITGQGSMHGANTMALYDYDGDGDLDLFWGDFFEAGLLLFENIGNVRRAEDAATGRTVPPAEPCADERLQRAGLRRPQRRRAERPAGGRDRRGVRSQPHDHREPAVPDAGCRGALHRADAAAAADDRRGQREHAGAGGPRRRRGPRPAAGEQDRPGRPQDIAGVPVREHREMRGSHRSGSRARWISAGSTTMRRRSATSMATASWTS